MLTLHRTESEYIKMDVSWRLRFEYIILTLNRREYQHIYPENKTVWMHNAWLFIFVSEWTSSDWCGHASLSLSPSLSLSVHVCVCVYVCV